MHVNASDVVLEKSREPIFQRGFLELVLFWSRKHGTLIR